MALWLQSSQDFSSVRLLTATSLAAQQKQPVLMASVTSLCLFSNSQTETFNLPDTPTVQLTLL